MYLKCSEISKEQMITSDLNVWKDFTDVGFVAGF